MGTLGYKYILYGYMEPLGYICGWLAKLDRVSFWVPSIIGAVLY